MNCTAFVRIARETAGDTEVTWQLSVPPPLPPATATRSLRAAADAYARDGTYAAQNFGTSAELQVKNAALSYRRESFLIFDLAGSGAIQSGVLRLYSKLSETGTAKLELVGLSGTGWTETGINWGNRPAITGTSLGVKTVQTTGGQWLEFNVTAFLQQQRNAGATKVTFALRSPEAAKPHIIIASDEATANRPELKWSELA